MKKLLIEFNKTCKVYTIIKALDLQIHEADINIFKTATVKSYKEVPNKDNITITIEDHKINVLLEDVEVLNYYLKDNIFITNLKFTNISLI